MRRNYPLISEEINDQILTAYEHYTYLIGYDDENGVTQSTGIYDTMELEYESYARDYLIFRNDNNLYDVNISGSISANFDKVGYALSLLRSKNG